jgi:hypothetical protein
LEFIIKAHPSFDYYELYRRLIEPAKCPNLAFLENTTLERILEASDVCLMINYCSTAALEAMIHKVPVVYLNNAVYPLKDWRDNLNAEGVHRIHSISKFQEILNLILNDTNTIKYSFENASGQVAEILDIQNSPAASRLLTVIEKLLEIKNIDSEISLLDATSMEALISTKRVESAELTGNAVDGRDVAGLMIAYSYLAGYNNLAHGSIDAVSKVLNGFSGGCDLKRDSCARSGLMASYISGRLKNWDAARPSIRDLGLIANYIIWPPKFVKLSVLERLNLIKYTIQTIRDLLILKVT